MFFCCIYQEDVYLNNIGNLINIGKYLRKKKKRRDNRKKKNIYIRGIKNIFIFYKKNTNKKRNFFLWNCQVAYRQIFVRII